MFVYNYFVVTKHCFVIVLLCYFYILCLIVFVLFGFVLYCGKTKTAENGTCFLISKQIMESFESVIYME